MPQSPGQPKRDYSSERKSGRIGGRLTSFGRGFGTGLGRAGGAFFSEFTKSGPRQQQQRSGNFSSKYFTKKRPYMQMKQGMSIISGMGASADEKRIAGLRAERQRFDPNRKDDPHLSTREANEIVEEVREKFGDTIAKEAEEKVKTIFGGRHTINSRELDLPFASIGRKYGRHTGEGLRLIKDMRDPKVQLGRGAKYLTEEKLENVIAETEKESGKYAAQALRKSFMVTQEEGMSKEDNGGSKPVKKSGWKISGLTGWGKKTNNDNK